MCFQMHSVDIAFLSRQIYVFNYLMFPPVFDVIPEFLQRYTND